jgi:hypothetical protein
VFLDCTVIKFLFLSALYFFHYPPSTTASSALSDPMGVNRLVDVITALRDEAARVFFASVSQQTDRLVAAPPPPTHDLQPPPLLVDMLQRLVRVVFFQYFCFFSDATVYCIF